MRGDRPQGTKLLVATIGLATVSYVGCGGPDHPPGNLMVTPQPTETATATPDDHPPGNLMAPPDVPTAEPTASGSTTPVTTATVATSASASVKPTATGKPPPGPKDHPHGNLMAPPPPPPKK